MSKLVVIFEETKKINHGKLHFNWSNCINRFMDC
jgi:hypothetical protein